LLDSPLQLHKAMGVSASKNCRFFHINGAVHLPTQHLSTTAAFAYLRKCSESKKTEGVVP